VWPIPVLSTQPASTLTYELQYVRFNQGFPPFDRNRIEAQTGDDLRGKRQLSAANDHIAILSDRSVGCDSPSVVVTVPSTRCVRASIVGIINLPNAFVMSRALREPHWRPQLAPTGHGSRWPDCGAYSLRNRHSSNEHTPLRKQQDQRLGNLGGAVNPIPGTRITGADLHSDVVASE
jgi:hypothetical protein